MAHALIANVFSYCSWSITKVEFNSFMLSSTSVRDLCNMASVQAVPKHLLVQLPLPLIVDSEPL